MKNLKTLTIILLTALPVYTSAQAENNEKFRIGFQLNEVHNDFGLGVNLSSPAILNKSFELHLRTNLMFYEYVKETKMVWESYFNILLGISSVPYKISESVSLYGEGGGIVVIPSYKFSKQTTEIGGYGLFGFEFYFSDNYCFFLEAGAVGTNAVADKVVSKPIYSNGFLTSVGWKLKL